MTAECRPPEGTPDGTRIVLTHWNRSKIEGHWRDGIIDLGWKGRFSPAEVFAHGYRRVRLATPSEGGKDEG